MIARRLVVLAGLSTVMACGGSVLSGGPDPADSDASTSAPGADAFVSPESSLPDSAQFLDQSSSSSSSGGFCPGTEASGALVSKSFLSPSPGFQWQMTVTAVSSSPALAALTPGTNWIADGTFIVQSGTLQFVQASEGETRVLDAWPVSNVTVDPECSSEGTTGDWQNQPWLQWSVTRPNLDDLIIFEGLSACVLAATPATTTLEAGSFQVNTSANTLEWRVQVSVPLSCPDVSGSTLNVELAYSFAPFG